MIYANVREKGKHVRICVRAYLMILLVELVGLARNVTVCGSETFDLLVLGAIDW